MWQAECRETPREPCSLCSGSEQLSGTVTLSQEFWGPWDFLSSLSSGYQFGIFRDLKLSNHQDKNENTFMFYFLKIKFNLYENLIKYFNPFKKSKRNNLKYKKHANNMEPSPQLPVLLSCCPVHLLSSASVEILLLQEGISGVAVQASSGLHQSTIG